VIWSVTNKAATLPGFCPVADLWLNSATRGPNNILAASMAERKLLYQVCSPLAAVSKPPLGRLAVCFVRTAASRTPFDARTA